jgi:hypothetical protein
MNNHLNNLSSSVILMVGLLATGSLSCSTTRSSTGSTKKDSPEYLARKLESNRLSASWFEGKARIDYNDGNQVVRVNATIRMREDSAIWVAVRKLGFEVVRTLVTSDSVFIIDRFNNAFYAYDLQYLSKTYQLPANLPILQNILLGNPLSLPFISRTITPEGTDFWLEETATSHKVRHLINGDNYRMEALEYRDIQSDRKLSLQLAEYDTSTGKHNFSYLRKVTLETQESGKISVELKFSEVELNVPKDLPFDVPERYLRVQ